MLVASTVTVVVAVIGRRLAHRSAKKPDGDRRRARRWIAGREGGCADAVRGVVARETSAKAEKRLGVCILIQAFPKLRNSSIMKVVRLNEGFRKRCVALAVVRENEV